MLETAPVSKRYEKEWIERAKSVFRRRIKQYLKAA
jgi:hypothetical protein